MCKHCWLSEIVKIIFCHVTRQKIKKAEKIANKVYKQKQKNELKQNKKYVTKKKHITFDDDSFLENDSIDVNNLITKEKVFIIDECSLEKAITKFEQTDYSFYIFKELDSDDEMAVLYRRADDTLGIIRCR